LAMGSVKAKGWATGRDLVMAKDWETGKDLAPGPSS